MPNASGFEPQPLGRHERAGKARIGRPGSQETSLRPEGRSPRGKGWLISMHKLITGLVAGLVLLATAPAAFAGPTVTVRVEGQSGTLLERTRVTLPDNPSAGNPCGATNAAA